MNRREFLQSIGLIAFWPVARNFSPWFDISSTALDRLEKWVPSTDNSIRTEWRYVAGRIVDGGQDFGFIISMSTVKVSGLTGQALTIHRQDFMGDMEFLGNTYTGTLDYDDTSNTYTFKDAMNQVLATWQWDDSAQKYILNTSTTELNLSNVEMIPQGDLIPEGGNGIIKSGRIGEIIIESDYYADWVKIEIGGVEKGVARVDMQGLRRVGTDPDGGDVLLSEYDHRWFAIAVELQDSTPAWVSVWQIEDPDGPYWTVTIARGSGGTWNVSSTTQEDAASIIAPLEITTLGFQSLPEPFDSTQSTGKRWRLTAGKTQLNDLIDLEVSVPPGQFIVGDTLALSAWAEEATGIDVQGTILNMPISSVKLLAAESSFEYYRVFLPAILS